MFTGQITLKLITFLSINLLVLLILALIFRVLNDVLAVNQLKVTSFYQKYCHFIASNIY